MPARHAVAAGHALTVEAADEILRAGGSAVDAAVGGALAACVCEPVLASLFGGGFLTVRTPDGKTGALDMFVQTPRRRTPAADAALIGIDADFGGVSQRFTIGAGTIATPGLGPGLGAAHAALGRMPLAEVAAPAVRLAAQGVAVTPFQSELARIVLPILRATPEAAALFLDDGAPPAPGTVRTNPALADMIETFGIEGARFLTEGEPAQALAELCRAGGRIDAQDLRDWAPRWRTPLERRRGAATVMLNPPPSLGGPLVALILALTPENADPAAVARALAAAAAARIEAGVDAAPMEAAARLAEPDLLARARAMAEGRPRSTTGTTHVSVVDRTGAAAALTVSNGAGAGLIVPGTGSMANNMMGEDDLLPLGPDGWTPGVRLASMMAPTVMVWPDGAVAALGSGGSNRIRSAMARVIARLGDGRESLEDAVSAPRVHVEAQAEDRERDVPPFAVDFEDRIGERARTELRAAFPQARGWERDSMFFGGVHAARRDAAGGVEAFGDPRRDGAALTG